MTVPPSDPWFRRYHGNRFRPYAPYVGCGCLLLLLLLALFLFGLLPASFTG